MAGISYDIVVLSSSPAHDLYAPSSPLHGSPRCSPRRVAMPASPLLALSPPVSAQKKGPGAWVHASRKADIPPDVIQGFATVGSLVRSEHFAQQFDDDIAGKDQAQSRRGSTKAIEGATAAKKKPTKPSARAPEDDGDGDAKPKPRPRARKPTATVTGATTLDPELRLPAPKILPFFAAEDAQASVEPPKGPSDNVPNLTKSGKPRKPRANKEKVEGDDAPPKPKRTRTTKPKANAKDSGKLQRGDAYVESAHFRTDATTDGLANADATNTKLSNTDDASIWEVPTSPQPKQRRSAKQRPQEQVETLDLDEAVSRRRDWTPPRDTATAVPLTDSAGKENKAVESDTNNGEFTHMISNFAYAQGLPAQVAATVAASTTGTMAVTKRRRVELVDVPGNQTTSRNSSPEKGKAPKKKPRTITDIATEQYQPRHAQFDSSDVTSDFFQARTTVTKAPLNDQSELDGDAPLKKPPRKRSTSRSASGNEKVRAKIKAKKASTKSAVKPKHVAEKLLSPGSALMQMNKQDILFGTSSQLALEESPTLVRQIQHALKESEDDADNSFNELMAPPRRWPKLDKVIGKRSLWDASSRDVDGGLLEQTRDVYIPEFDRTQDFPLLMDGTNDEPDAAPPSFVDVNNVEPIQPVLISSDIPTPPRTMSKVLSIVDNLGETRGGDRLMEDSVFEDIDDFDSQPPPSNQNVESQVSFEDIDDVPLASFQPNMSLPPKPRPPASAPSTGSPKKRRGRPPKSQSAIPTMSTSPTSMNRSKDSSVRPKLKLTKSTSAPPTTPSKGSGRFINIDEILDSDDEVMQALSPTPPRIRSFQNSIPLPLFSTSPTLAKKPSSKFPVDPKVVQVHIIPIAHLEWPNLRGSVFSSITEHIRGLPPTADPKKPSWHEKILMYGPIVLEDFTAYLNASTGLRTWRRATKIQTKAYNKEMKAIGEETVSVIEGGGDVLAVEKELEAWQVQAWCESMSVCCIWGEGRGKGGVRKGFY